MGNIENCGINNHDESTPEITVDHPSNKEEFTKQKTSELKRSAKENLP